MLCPYCGVRMDLYESFLDEEEDGVTIKRQENFFCAPCDKSFSRNATYKLEYATELEE